MRNDPFTLRNAADFNFVLGCSKGPIKIIRTGLRANLEEIIFFTLCIYIGLAVGPAEGGARMWVFAAICFLVLAGAPVLADRR